MPTTQQTLRRTAIFIMTAIFLLLYVPCAHGDARRYNRALHLYEQGVYMESARELRTYLRGEPNDFEAGKLLARILLRMEEYEELAEVTGRLIRLRPDDKEAAEMHRRALRERAPPAPAVTAAQLEADLRRTPDDAGLHLRLIEMYTHARRDNDVDRLFRGLVRLRPRNADYHLRYARFLAQRQREKEAETHYRIALEIRDNPVVRREMFHVILRPVEELLRQKKFDEALRFQQQVRERYPEEKELQLNYARILSYAEHYEESLAAYRKYLKEDADISVRLEVVRVLTWKEDMPAALKEIELLLEEEPDNIEALVLRGNIYRWTDNPDEARDMYKLALESEPTHPGALEGLKELEKIAEERAREAAAYNLEYMRSLVAAEPDNEQARLQLARLQAIASEYGESVSNYRFYLARHPDNLPVRLEYGRVLSSMDNLHGAAEQFHIYLKENPGDQTVRAHLADLLLWQMDTAGAERELQKIVRANPRDIPANWNLFRISRAREDWEVAKYHLQVIAELDPSYFAVQAAIREIESHPRYRFEYLTREIAEAPRDIEKRMQLARLLVGLGRHYEAGETLRSVLELSPGHRDAQRLLRESESQLARQREEKINELRAHLRQNPDDQKVNLELAALLAASKRNDEAIRRYRRHLQRYPDDIDVRREYARLISWLPEHQGEALREYRILADYFPDDTGIELTLARLMFYEKDDWRAAEAKIESLLHLHPEDIKIQVALADAYFYQGRYTEARTAYRKVLDVEPQNLPARDRLDNIRQLHRPSANATLGFSGDSDNYRERFILVNYTHFLESLNAVGVTVAQHQFRQDDDLGKLSAQANRFSAFMQGRVNRDTTGRFWLGASNYDLRSTSFFVGARLDHRLDGRNTIGVEYSKDDAVYDVKTVTSLERDIEADRLKIEWTREHKADTESLPDKISVDAMLSYASFSDANRQTSVLVRLAYPLRPEPPLDVLFGWRSLSYTKETDAYWSPASYGGPLLGVRMRRDWEKFRYALDFETVFSGFGSQRSLSGQIQRYFRPDLVAGLVVTFSESPREDDTSYRHNSTMLEVRARF